VGWGHFTMEGLIGWGALVARARQQDPPEPDPRPGTKPWEQLGDLASLTEQLGAALGRVQWSLTTLPDPLRDGLLGFGIWRAFGMR
jgi:hypothetical protein